MNGHFINDDKACEEKVLSWIGFSRVFFLVLKVVMLEDNETNESITEEPEKEGYGKNIENQLREIQNRLKSLSN